MMIKTIGQKLLKLLMVKKSPKEREKQNIINKLINHNLLYPHLTISEAVIEAVAEAYGEVIHL